MIASLLCSVGLLAAPGTDTLAARLVDTVLTTPAPAVDTLRLEDDLRISGDTLHATPGDLRASINNDSLLRVALHGSRPDPFDWITNLPSDWWEWGEESLTLENLPMMGAIGVLTAGLVLTDRETFDPLWHEYHRSTVVRDLSDMFVFTGDGKFQFGMAILFAGYGFIADDDRAVRTASQVTEVILACGAVVQVLKHATGRESPFVATTPTGRWRLFPNQIEYHKRVPHYDAYPSGHVATAMATLTVISQNYPEAEWIPWVGYPIIAGLATGMVASGIHWWSDYPLSVALGYGFGMVVSRRLQPTGRIESAQGEGGPEIGMTFLRDGTPAMSLTWAW